MSTAVICMFTSHSHTYELVRRCNRTCVLLYRYIHTNTHVTSHVRMYTHRRFYVCSYVHLSIYIYTQHACG